MYNDNYPKLNKQKNKNATRSTQVNLYETVQLLFPSNSKQFVSLEYISSGHTYICMFLNLEFKLKKIKSNNIFIFSMQYSNISK